MGREKYKIFKAGLSNYQHKLVLCSSQIYSLHPIKYIVFGVLKSVEILA
jgi:hypothetical protein